MLSVVAAATVIVRDWFDEFVEVVLVAGGTVALAVFALCGLRQPRHLHS